VSVADLLLHSMAEFHDVILPALEAAGARDLVEIGSEAGTMTQSLLDYAARAGGTLLCVDPAPGPEVAPLLDRALHARLLRATGVAAIPRLEADAWIVDGDHNWYTVYHESCAIWDRAQATGRPFLAFYHDVGWPWARRDLYYAPDAIPAEFVHPHDWDRGVTLDDPGTIDGGFRGLGNWACACHEGGPKNGVLTAIEDFAAGKEDTLVYAHVPAVFGLGVLFDRTAPWAEAVASVVAPYHRNPLLARLERNRLECYLRVIALQDSMQPVPVTADEGTHETIG
jgi:hypothetical protein